MSALRFRNVGPAQVPGVICMEIVSGDQIGASSDMDDSVELTTCASFKRVLVVFNARPHSFTAPWPPDALTLQQHPVQLASKQQAASSNAFIDCNARTVEVSARAMAAFVEPREP
eukprot:scaffold218673_cov44-Prasinocladus_malaysianus.AAC.1